MSDLPELVRAAEVGDARAAERLAHALTREKGVAEVALELARLVDASPGNRALLVALDAIAPCGLDPLAPCAGPLKGGGATRSPAVGPSVGIIESRVPLRERFARDHGTTELELAVTPSGRVIAPFVTKGVRALHGLDLEGRIGDRSLEGTLPFLLAGWAVAVDRRDKVVRAVSAGGRRVTLDRSSFVVLGCGHAIQHGGGGDKVVVAAHALSDPAVERWRQEVPGGHNRTSDLMFLPGARVGIITWLAKDRMPGASGIFAVMDVATGERVATVKLPDLPANMYSVLGGRNGLTYLGLVGGVAALSGEEIVWRIQQNMSVLGFAGAGGAVLLGYSLESDSSHCRLHGFDAGHGGRIWKTRIAPWAPEPRIDATGRIFARCGGELVALDPANGMDIFSVPIGHPHATWGFAITGSGRAVVALCGEHGERDELIVIR